MSAWNFNIAEAPRGSTVSRTVVVKDKEVSREVFVVAPVILATKCGQVMASEWLPKAERWHGLATGEQPVAWWPWPTHPTSSPTTRDGLANATRFIRWQN